MNNDRKEQIHSMVSLDNAATDGIYAVPFKKKDLKYDIRAMCVYAEKLGRPLTNKEAKQFIKTKK